MEFKQFNIRNFSIIAHIDHGKSTLADRLLEHTKTVSPRDLQSQVLDDMDLERERGITIKSHIIKMCYYHNNTQYHLNLIDTPGHVDFSYEVTRCLAACEGAILIVDASQGIEAQTLSNLYTAIELDLAIIPIINKIDLPAARPDEIAQQVGELLGYDPQKIPRVSAKNGIGIESVLSKIIEEIPAPKGDINAPAQALIFDSKFDAYLGTITYIRVFAGTLNPHSKVKFLVTNTEYECTELGFMTLKRNPTEQLRAGEVGYLVGNIKNVRDVKIGDTVTSLSNPSHNKLDGFKEVYPMVFAGLYPIDSEHYENLGKALEKLQLNDSSLSWVIESSEALGFGYRVGFLGLLHLEIIAERLEREFNVPVITTVPNVVYQVYMNDGTVVTVENPGNLPEAGTYSKIAEPFVKTQFILPKEYIGALMKLCEEKRGVYDKMEYLSQNKVTVYYELPLAEIMFDFYDKLKSTTKGYASMDYEHSDYQQSALVKLDILINTKPVDAFSIIIHKDKAFYWGRALCEKLKGIIPKQMFEVAIQASIGTRVIARTTIKAYRKNVTAKCYGGDITRKRKLLEKQKEGKKRMKSVGNVEIPQEAFLAVLSMGKS